MKFFTSIKLIEGLQEINMQYNWMEVRKGWSAVLTLLEHAASIFMYHNTVCKLDH